MGPLERRVVMTRHTMMLGAAFAAAFAISMAVVPARTAPEIHTAAIASAQPQSVQSAQVHALVGASFHAISVGF